MAGKVLVSTREHIDRLVAARLQCDVMGASTLLIARTDAEAATLLDNNIDERDHPHILGTQQLHLPSLNEVMQEAQEAGKGPDDLADIARQWEVRAQLCTLSAAVEDAILSLPFASSDRSARSVGLSLLPSICNPAACRPCEAGPGSG